jgi:photosystem II stability/assembly factor-like uncharacterized protein
MERKYQMKKTIIVLLITFSMPVFSQWVQTQSTPEGGGITDMIITDAGALIVTTSSFNWPSGQYGGIRRSTDGGDYWETPINGYTARTLAISRGGYIFASSWPYPNPEALYRSTDDGNTFFQQYQIGTNNNIFSIIAPSQDNNTIYIGTRNGILKSSNGGTVFNSVNNGIPANSWVWDLAVDSNNIIAAATSNGLFISTNLGNSWYQSTGLPAGDTVTSVCFYSANTDNGFTEKLIAGTDDGKIVTSSSTAGYAGLIVSALLGTNVRVESVSKTYISLEELNQFYITTRGKNPLQPGGGVYKSTDEGQTFTVINNGLPQNPVVSKIIVDPNDTGGVPRMTSIKLFAGLFNNQNNGAQIYTQTFPIGIQQISSEVPKGFTLSQNYPNPFNPNTKIKFQITKLSAAKLVVFDALGREIETLVDEQLRPGTYEVDYDGSRLSSGVYYYKLITGGFVDTKKMILVK